MQTMPSTVAPMKGNNNPPVLLLGGAENAVACARRFVGQGITTVVVNSNHAPALRSRGVVRQGLGAKIDAAVLSNWLMGKGLEWAGSVLIPLSDQAVLALVEHQKFLSDAYRPALIDPTVAAAMLDKQVTLEVARDAGVSTPRQWVVSSAGIEPVVAELQFPIILKPRRNFELLSMIGRKYIRVEDVSELRRCLPQMQSLPSGFVLNEFVPGGDELLSSYNALRSPDGEVLIEFTKRVDRRYQPNEGGATFHELVDLPATAAVGRRFFDHVGLIGFGNVEFKTDQRTGELKLIECNHRLTAATRLMQDHGIDIAGAIYDQAVDRRPVLVGSPQWGATLWYPIRDLRSFMISGGGIRAWLSRPKRSTLPYWKVSDPGPSMVLWWRTVRAHMAKRFPH
jgi:D-aspartate ligase